MYLFREAQAKPYDSKKSYWCPDGEGGFLESLLESDDGGKAVVTIGHEVIFIKNLISSLKYLFAVFNMDKLLNPHYKLAKLRYIYKLNATSFYLSRTKIILVSQKQNNMIKLIIFFSRKRHLNRNRLDR